MLFESISTPTLILNKNRCLENIRTMYEKARKSGVILRPHFKTHQSLEIGRWFREAGTEAITVSSVRMAEYFSHDGWKDITIAFPLNIRELNEINKLSEQANLHVLIESPEVISYMEEIITHPIGVFLKIDTGSGRTGLKKNDSKTARDIILRLEKNPLFHFRGFLAHAGHTYKTSEVDEILRIYEETVEVLTEMKHRMKDVPGDMILSVGDTPSCSLMDRFDKVNEIRPGNFVFYDLMQHQLGSCTQEEIAVALAVPVVAKHADRNEMVVYGGAIHLSKESITDPEGRRSFGQVVQLKENGWGAFENGCYVSGLSQEHGIIKVTGDLMNSVSIGDLIGIIPVHSCLTANLMKGYVTLDGEDIDHMEGT